jgi:hypothetical protein
MSNETKFAKLICDYFYTDKKGNGQMDCIFMAISESILEIQGDNTTTFIELAENDEDFSLDDLEDLSVQQIEDLTKKYITQIQLAQFVICIVHFFGVYFYDIMYPKDLAYIQLFYHIKMIILFTNFYSKTYKNIATM